jgi:predicted NodU family carbamoyl transferase
LPILGIWDGHDAGAAVVDESNGESSAPRTRSGSPAVSSRSAFPRQHQACLEEPDLSAGEVDEVAVSTFDPRRPSPDLSFPEEATTS